MNIPLSLPLDTQTVNLLQTYGHTVINSAKIASTPIVINGIPVPARHVYLILELQDVSLVIEKNDRVELSIYTSRSSEQSTVIWMIPGLVSTFIHNGILSYQNKALALGHGLNQFWSMYHLEHNNCQQFVFRLLHTNQWQTKDLEQYNQKAEHMKNTLHEQSQHLSEKNKIHPLAQMASKLITSKLFDVFANFGTTLMRQQQVKLPDSDLVTMDGIHFHAYPNSTPLEAYGYEEEWFLDYTRHL